MNTYPAKMAQQALRELLKDAPLEERVTNAYAHLSFADNDDHIQDSQSVKESLVELDQAFDSGSLTDKARAVGDVIECIMMERGFNDSVEQDS